MFSNNFANPIQLQNPIEHLNWNSSYIFRSNFTLSNVLLIHSSIDFEYMPWILRLFQFVAWKVFFVAQSLLRSQYSVGDYKIDSVRSAHTLSNTLYLRKTLPSDWLWPIPHTSSSWRLKIERNKRFKLHDNCYYNLCLYNMKYKYHITWITPLTYYRIQFKRKYILFIIHKTQNKNET